MAIAIAEERTILTFDSDYGELIFRYNYKPEKGVIYLRLDEYAPHEPGLIIEQLITNSHIDVTQALTVIDKNGILKYAEVLEKATLIPNFDAILDVLKRLK